MIKNRQPIGMMDSGVGGLTVLLATQKRLPNERFVYVGDTARMPYGNKNPQSVIQYSQEIAEYLVKKHNIKLLVIACNTASAYAIPILEKELTIPVIGVITAGAQAAVAVTTNRQVGLIATQGTVDSGRYQAELQTFDPEVAVVAQAEPDFVALVEDNQAQNPAYQTLVSEHLAVFKNDGVDTLILGCTHFPLMRELIQNAVGDEIKLVDPGQQAAENIATDLAAHHLLATAGATTPDIYYTTGDCQAFQTIATAWLKSTEPLQIAHLTVKNTAGYEYLEESPCHD